MVAVHSQLVDDVAWIDDYRDDSPLERLVDAGGRVGHPG